MLIVREEEYHKILTFSQHNTYLDHIDNYA